MSKIMVNLNSFEKVKNFVNITNHMDCKIDLMSGRYIVDGKSIMGIFSLDLSKPIEMHIDTNEEIIVPKELEGFINY